MNESVFSYSSITILYHNIVFVTITTISNMSVLKLGIDFKCESKLQLIDFIQIFKHRIEEFQTNTFADLLHNKSVVFSKNFGGFILNLIISSITNCLIQLINRTQILKSQNVLISFFIK